MARLVVKLRSHHDFAHRHSNPIYLPGAAEPLLSDLLGAVTERSDN